jgi:hypothetical protein
VAKILVIDDDVRPGIEVLEVSSKTGKGMPEWFSLLDSRRGARGL